MFWVKLGDNTFKTKMDEELKKSILKTGTTILGIVCKDGVVMAADRQTTAGQSIVMNKKAKKAVMINDYLVFAGAGVASDIRRTEKILRAELKLKELRAKSRPTVKQAANLLNTITYSQIRQPSMIPNIVGSLIAGVNEDGSLELYTIEPAGSVVLVDDYDANFGSGMPFVLGLGSPLLIKSPKQMSQQKCSNKSSRDHFNILSFFTRNVLYIPQASSSHISFDIWMR